MTDVKEPVLRYARLETASGTMLAAATPAGLFALRFCARGKGTRIPADLRRQHPRVRWLEDPESMRPLLAQVAEVMAGRLPADRVPLDLAGTAFQKRVWLKLLQVPWGKTVSYSDLARRVGKPRAVRAVASACARNPIAGIIPCHRVLRKSGDLGGYYWGLEKKRELLARESP